MPVVFRASDFLFGPLLLPKGIFSKICEMETITSINQFQFSVNIILQHIIPLQSNTKKKKGNCYFPIICSPVVIFREVDRVTHQ